MTDRISSDSTTLSLPRFVKRSLLGAGLKRTHIRSISRAGFWVLTWAAIGLALVCLWNAFSIAYTVGKTPPASKGLGVWVHYYEINHHPELFGHIIDGGINLLFASFILLIAPIVLQHPWRIRRKWPFKMVDFVWYPAAIVGFALAFQGGSSRLYVNTLNAKTENVLLWGSKLEIAQAHARVQCQNLVRGPMAHAYEAFSQHAKLLPMEICGKDTITLWHELEIGHEYLLEASWRNNIACSNFRNVERAVDLSRLETEEFLNWTILVEPMLGYCLLEDIYATLLKAYSNTVKNNKLDDHLKPYVGMLWLLFLYFGASLKICKVFVEVVLSDDDFDNDRVV